MKFLRYTPLFLLMAGCSSLHLVLINTSDRPVKHVELRLNQVSTLIPEIDPGQSQSLKVNLKGPTNIAVNYQDPEGHQFYTSAPQVLQAGDGGSLRLSITAQGTLGAVRIP